MKNIELNNPRICRHLAQHVRAYIKVAGCLGKRHPSIPCQFSRLEFKLEAEYPPPLQSELM